MAAFGRQGRGRKPVPRQGRHAEARARAQDRQSPVGLQRDIGPNPAHVFVADATDEVAVAYIAMFAWPV